MLCIVVSRRSHFSRDESELLVLRICKQLSAKDLDRAFVVQHIMRSPMVKIINCRIIQGCFDGSLHWCESIDSFRIKEFLAMVNQGLSTFGFRHSTH